MKVSAISTFKPTYYSNKLSKYDYQTKSTTVSDGNSNVNFRGGASKLAGGTIGGILGGLTSLVLMTNPVGWAAGAIYAASVGVGAVIGAAAGDKIDPDDRFSDH